MKAIRYIRTFVIAFALLLTTGTLLRAQCYVDYIDNSQFQFGGEGAAFDEGFFMVSTNPQSCVFTDPGGYDWVYYEMDYIDEWTGDVWYKIYCDPNYSGVDREAYLYLTGTDFISVYQTSIAPPDPPGPISGPTSICTGGTTYQYSIDPVSIAEDYEWTLPTGWTIVSGLGTTSITVSIGQWYTADTVLSVRYSTYDDLYNLVWSDPSETGLITVNGPVHIWTHPSNHTRCEGENAGFSISASNASSYQWYKGESLITGATASSYSISSVSMADAGNYRVKIFGSSCSTEGVFSNYATLTVNQAVSITTQPTPQTACTGTNATFSVTAAGTGLSYQWEKNGSPIAGATSSSYIISSVNSADAANYRVKVNGTCNPTGIYSNSVSLTVNIPVSITSQPTSQAVCTGGNTTFSVTAAGTGLSYQWEKNGSPIAGATGFSYTISSVNSADAANYRVKVSGTCNPTGIYSNSVSLTVNFPVSITSQPTSQAVCIGSNTTFSVSAAGTGLSYQWEKNGSPIAGATSSSYTISSVNSADAANYRVKVSGTCNPTGIYSNSVSLTVNTPVSITSHPSSQIICTGGNTTFSVTATGTGLSYQWEKNDSPIAGATGSSYTISSVNSADAANYRVKVSGTCNSTGIYSNSVSLTVNIPVSITSQPSSQTVCIGGNTTFSVTAAGTGLSYQWEKNGSPIAGATGSSYTISSVNSADAANYRVKVSGTCNPSGIYSNSVSLAVNNPVSITSQPTSQTASPGINTTFSVTADGAGLTYQWEKNGSPISGATASSYTINSVNYADAGNYRVKVNGTCTPGGIHSEEALLSFNPSGAIPTDTVPYVMVTEPTKAVGTKSQLDTVDQTFLKQSIDYYDGTGRITQSVQAGASPGHNDIIQLHSYDKMGREKERLLPFTIASNNGAMVADAQSAQSSFYNNLFPGEGAYAKEITQYENSPMSRTLSQTAPGTGWQTSGNEKKVTYSYSSNQADEVIHFTVDSITLIRNNHYPAGVLRKVTVTDSNHDGGTNPLNSTIEFRNSFDELVLRRTFVEGENEQTDIIDTYYVHDQRGQLRYTITPEAVANIGTATQYTSETALIKNLCYYYQYDNRGRLVIKQLPGAAPEYMVYDIRDRLVLRQDGNMRSADRWHFTKYDAHNREAVTGLLIPSPVKDRETMQADADNAYSGQSHRQLWIDRENGQTIHMGYSNTSYPNTDDGTLEYLTATWYDSYGFPGALLFSTTHDISDGNFVTDPAGYNAKIAGLVTGRALKILGTSDYVTTTNYYDDLYRVIQTRQDLYDGTQGGSNEIVSQRFDFSGKLVESRQVQLFDSQTLVVTEERTYDHAGRLLQRTHKTGGRAAVVLAEIEYNELGQLSEKSLHETAPNVFMQQIDYSYNIRGWMTSMNNPDNIGSDLFAIRLLYDDVSQLSPLDSARAQYNGNIAGVIWNGRTGASQTTLKRAYSYIYDANNRITESYYGVESGGNLVASQNFREYGYSYDLNGNILSLKRTNSAGLLIDDLNYAYGSGSNYSNRLLNVTDNTTQAAGFNDGHTSAQNNDYEYDFNGSMNVDRNKGITIEYNFLNLPQKVIKDASNYIEYFYDASARKVMQKVVTSGVATERFYHNGFEYGPPGIELVHTGEGVVNVSTSDNNHRYNYFLKDHLGSTRVVFGEDTQGELIVNQVTDYYAFGLAHEPGFGMGDTRYLYNGKELQDDLSLDWLDYGWRMYDPQIGRWHSMDPLAEHYFSYSPYNYVLNNPIKFIDPDGRKPFSLNFDFSFFQGVFQFGGKNLGGSWAPFGSNGIKLSGSLSYDPESGELTYKYEGSYYNERAGAYSVGPVGGAHSEVRSHTASLQFGVNLRNGKPVGRASLHSDEDYQIRNSATIGVATVDEESVTIGIKDFGAGILGFGVQGSINASYQY